MKRFLVVALAVIMSICALAMVGCGEGVKYEDFNAQATALKANDPAYTKGTVWFKFSGDKDYGGDIDFEIVDKDGVEDITFQEKQMKNGYHQNVWELIPRELETAVIFRRYAWDEKQVENKSEKTDNGGEFKTTAVYNIKEELSFRVEDYMKTPNGNEATSIAYRKYEPSTGYLIEQFTQSNTGTKIYIKIEWKAN